MRKKFYFPNGEVKRMGWLEAFNKKLPAHAALFNITPAELTRLDKMTKYYSSLINQFESLNQSLKAATVHKKFFCNARMNSSLDNFPTFTVNLAPNPAEAGLWDFVSSLVNRIKATRPGYTDAIGKGLGIEGHEPEFDSKTYKPKITSVKVKPGPHLILRYKKGVTDGANFYCRTNGGAWVKRDYDTKPPYDDRTPLAVAGAAEKREYRCRAVINDVEIGVYSDIEEVMVG